MEKVGISREVLAAIRAHAATEPDREVCGLLFGALDFVDEARSVENVAAEPSRRFEIDPKDLFVAIRAERTGGPKLAGYYHSHPNGRAEPSAADREGAGGDGRVWLIVAGEAITGWRATPNGFEEVEIVQAPLAHDESVGH